MPATSLYERLDVLGRSLEDDGVPWRRRVLFLALDRHVALESLAYQMCDTLYYQRQSAGEVISRIVAILTPSELSWMLSYTWLPGFRTDGRETADLRLAVLCGLDATRGDA